MGKVFRGRSFFPVLIAVSCFMALGLTCQGAATANNVRAVVDAAIDRMRPALVRIHVVSTEYRDGREIKMQAVGSGAIITKDGFLVTNHHVAGHGARMFCTFGIAKKLKPN